MDTNQANNKTMDVTAENSKAIIQAALLWNAGNTGNSVLTKEEWKLSEACDKYGTHFRGLGAGRG